MEQIIKIWAGASKGITPDTVDHYLYGITIGTLTAAKLLIRLRSGGTLTFAGDPRVFQSVEELGDEVAAEFYDIVARDVLGYETFRSRIRSEKRFLRAVGSEMTWRWSKENVLPDDPISVPPERLLASREIAEDVSWNLMDFLALAKGAVAHDRTLAETESIAQLIGMVGASKLLLAIWGNDSTAAVFEWFADKMSEQRYRDLTLNNG